MGYPIKLSQTAQPLLFFMQDSSSTRPLGKTGLSPTVTLSKNGGSFASPSGAVTEIASGWYKVAGNATDSNTLGPLLLHATGTGADPTEEQFSVVAYDPQSATDLGLSRIDMPLSDIPTTNEIWDYNIGSGTAAENLDELYSRYGGIGIADPGTIGGLPLLDSNLRVKALAEAISNGAITAAAIATDAIDGDAIANSAVTEIQSGLATAAALATLDDFVDTEVAAIKAKTDLLPSVAAGSEFGLPIVNAIGEVAAVVNGQVEANIAGFTIDGASETKNTVWGSTTERTLTSFGTLVADTAAAVWDKALTGIAAAGSVGLALKNMLADWLVIITGEGTAGAKFTETALENAPSGGGSGSGSPYLLRGDFTMRVDGDGPDGETEIDVYVGTTPTLRIRAITEGGEPIPMVGPVVGKLTNLATGSTIADDITITEIDYTTGYVQMQVPSAASLVGLVGTRLKLTLRWTDGDDELQVVGGIVLRILSV